MTTKVLITNDDGYNSYGLKILRNILSEFFQEIYVVAPKNNMSGSSRSISLKKKIDFKKISSLDWVVDGTPTDCMIFALNSIFEDKYPDYIFSGINAGTNIGDEITYSGTVGAAFEGALRGIPSLAISQKIKFNIKNEYTVAKEKLPNVIFKILKNFSKSNLLLNLNLPLCETKKVKGLKIVNCSNQKLSDKVFVNYKKSSFKIGPMNITNPNEIDDLKYINNNYITLSSLVTNLTKKSNE